MNIVWTNEAKKSYKIIIANILENWNIEIVLKLENEVDSLLNNLSNNKHLCPKSSQEKKLRRCVISKQTSLLYEIQGNSIYLISFFDNRTNHKHF